MSGVSPGRGHPGRGDSPSKAQASRPTLGENSQAPSHADFVQRNPPHGSYTSLKTVNKKMEESAVRKETSAVGASGRCEVKQSPGHSMQHGEQAGDQRESIVGNQSAKQIQRGAEERNADPGSGVQIHPPAHRHRRTSLERQTLQQNLQQGDLVSSMTRSGRTRSQAGGKSHHHTDTSVTPGRSAGKSHGDCKAITDPECDRTPADTTAQGSPVFIQPDRPPRQQGPETTRAPELQLAEEIPALVRKMEELKANKLMLQMQIDCVYKLKTASPQHKDMHDKRLFTLSMELADTVKQMDCILERMGPLAESYRNQERFSQYRLNFDAESRSDVESDVPPDEPQQEARPLIQPASFSFQDGDISQRGEQPQTPAAVPEQDPEAQEPAEAPQVPEGRAQQDSGHLPENGGDGVLGQNCNAGARTGGDGPCDNAPEGSVAGGGAQSVWDILSDDDIEVDGVGDAVHNNVHEFPPLPTSTAPTAGPSRVAPQPVSQGSETRQVPPRNAWSRGAPSFTSGANYTGQAFKRRNVVRFRHRGAKEELPDRRFVVRELLCHQMGFVPGDILAVINLPDRQGYDVSFKLMSNLDRFWSHFPRFRDSDGWRKFSFIPISKPDTVIVNIIFWNEAVPPQDIVVWLRRHCDLVSDLTKNRDDDGIWTGGWKVLVKLRQHGNITQHLPNSFFIGREKGVCFYPGQPRKCFKCGKAGHLANSCTVIKCHLCGEIGHLSADCQNIRCNLCGEIGHAHRDCPDAWHNKELPDEDLVAGAEAAEEEEALMSGTILTRHVQQGLGDTVPEPQQSQSAQGDMEVVSQAQQQQGVSSSVSPPVSAPEENKSLKMKRRKKDPSSRRPEGQYNTGHSKRVNNGPGVMVVSNRFGVLSESEGDVDAEIKRLEGECEGDTEHHPPTKQKPQVTEAESDMETGGRQQDSDSDL